VEMSRGRPEATPGVFQAMEGLDALNHRPCILKIRAIRDAQLPERSATARTSSEPQALEDPGYAIPPMPRGFTSVSGTAVCTLTGNTP